jgi:hypothetical protein
MSRGYMERDIYIHIESKLWKKIRGTEKVEETLKAIRVLFFFPRHSLPKGYPFVSFVNSRMVL